MSKLVRTLTSLIAAVLLFTAVGYTQYAHMTLKADVPFEFAVGDRIFPAGHYYVTRIGPYCLALHDIRDRFLTSFMTSPVQARGRNLSPKLKFRMEAGRRVLTEVWQSGETVGYQLPAQRRLTAVAQEPPAQVVSQASAASGK